MYVHTSACLTTSPTALTLNRILTTWWRRPLLGVKIYQERFYHWTTTATATRTSKRTIGLLSKTTTLYVHHTFLYISLPSLHDYDVKCLISRFMEDVNKRWLIFLSLSKRKCGPEKINSRVRNSPTLFWHFHRIGINATVFEKTRIHFKSDVLASVAVNDAKAP